MNLQQTLNIQALSQVKLLKRNVMGIPCIIEHPKGTTRIIKNDKGKVVWKAFMYSDYGYIANTKGRDPDEVDVMIGPLTHFKDVFIVHMKDMGPVPSEREDEDKCMLGFPNEVAARKAFHLQYPLSFFESMTTMPIALFKKKLATSQLPYRHKKLHAQVA